MKLVPKIKHFRKSELHKSEAQLFPSHPFSSREPEVRFLRNGSGPKFHFDPFWKVWGRGAPAHLWKISFSFVSCLLPNLRKSYEQKKNIQAIVNYRIIYILFSNFCVLAEKGKMSRGMYVPCEVENPPLEHPSWPTNPSSLTGKAHFLP